MLAIFNSDVLLSGEFRRTDLPYRVKSLIQLLVEHDVTIVIPTTTQLEFDAKQQHLRSREIAKIQEANSTLRRYDLGVEFDVDSTIPSGTLEELMTNAGLPFDLVEPQYEDFHEGHRRACLHLAPGPESHEDGASDEMRDLVIWATACRLASEDDVMLISRDGVHTSPKAEVEAEELGLRVFASPEDAMESMSSTLFPIQRMIVEAAIKTQPSFFPNSDNFACTISAVFNTVGVEGIGETKFNAVFATRTEKGSRKIFDFEASFPEPTTCTYRAEEPNSAGVLNGVAQTDPFDPTALPVLEEDEDLAA